MFINKKSSNFAKKYIDIKRVSNPVKDEKKSKPLVKQPKRAKVGENNENENL